MKAADPVADDAGGCGLGATGTTTLTPVVDSATFVGPPDKNELALIAIDESADTALLIPEDTMIPGAVAVPVSPTVTARVTAAWPEKAGSVTDVTNPKSS